MARGATSSILLMLSLEALLLVAGISAAAASGDTDIIICLPTHVRAASAIAHDGEERPWECCDKAVCTRSFPPICRCLDVCHHGARHVHAAAAARVAKGGDDEKRPWKCCNRPICLMTWPLSCQCTDKVKRCASTCEHCEQVEGSQVYRCLDLYRGEPGPRCEDEEEEQEEKWAPAVASGHRFFLARKE
ncbi:hypothetical protein BS78_03G080200 [Paspalum vaginatum]|nr:hypothetical protein BS78_03G080200 [Paspalum vaginatum]